MRVNSALMRRTITASTNSPTNAGRYFLTFSPRSFAPAAKSMPRTTKVLSSLSQKAPLASWAPREAFSGAAFSPKAQVENLRAEKSKAPVSTATLAIAMTINPSHTASQSSVFQSFDQLILVLAMSKYLKLLLLISANITKISNYCPQTALLRVRLRPAGELRNAEIDPAGPLGRAFGLGNGDFEPRRRLRSG